MKKITDLQKLLDAEINTRPIPGAGIDVKKNKRIRYLRTCLYYLQSKPRESFLIKEKDRLIKLLEKIKEGEAYFVYNVAKPTDSIQKRKGEYNKLTDYTKHKNQLETINFLLSDN